MINISIALNALLVHNADMLNAEDIKTWLKKIGRDRAWLAEKTLVSKRTVDNWLSAGKPIVPQKMELIEKLMSGEDHGAAFDDEFGVARRGVIKITVFVIRRVSRVAVLGGEIVDVAHLTES